MNYKVGKSKPMTEVTLKDCLRYPIWEWALDEEALPGHDETWQRPITSTKDVTPDMVDPTITFRIAGSDLIGTAIYESKTGNLSSISIWDDGEWVDVCQFDSLVPPLVFTAVPTIAGRPGTRFLLSDLRSDKAARMGEGQAAPADNACGAIIRRPRGALAFILTGANNGSHMCGGADVLMAGLTGLAVCSACGIRTDFEYTNSDLRLHSRKYDFSETYEGCAVASDRFKSFCEASGFLGLRFVPLQSSKGFYHLMVDRTLPMDAERIGIKKQGYCGVCGNYREIFGLFTHHVRNLGSPLDDGIWRSDVVVGSGNWKGPVLYVGPITRQRMKEAGLKGIHFKRYP